MRLFVAVDFSDDLKHYLSSVGNLLKSDAATIAVAQEYHLTLKFLGEQTEEYANALKDKLSSINFEPFDGHLAKIGTVSDSGRIRVVWGSVTPEEPFANLAKEIDTLTPEVKNTYSDYKPHVTFARVKRVVAKDAFNALLSTVKLEEKKISVKAFKLYRSIPGQEGHRYDVLATYYAKA